MSLRFSKNEMYGSPTCIICSSFEFLVDDVDAVGTFEPVGWLKLLDDDCII